MTQIYNFQMAADKTLMGESVFYVSVSMHMSDTEDEKSTQDS